MNYASFGNLFVTGRYPAGEPHVRLHDEVEDLNVDVIETYVRDFNDLGILLTADRILKLNGVEVEWFVPYFPFARHDRRRDCRDGLELQLALEMVKDIDIVIADPHSDVAGMLPHIGQESVVRLMREEGWILDHDLIVIPDAGATKKAMEWINPNRYLQAYKKRNPQTGKLSGSRIDSRMSTIGENCIIVDDICDGGRTFLNLADELDKALTKTLIVTHGLFTDGTAALIEKFDRVITFAWEGQLPMTGVTQISYRALYENGVIQ